ncbi:MAG: hypothetical protein ABSE73_03720 [Planctomycetota bacterium]
MRQLIFYSLAEAELDNPRLLDRGLADVAAHGFDSVYLEYRNVRSGCTTPRFRKAVQVFCRRARARGLSVVVDASYNRLGEAIRAEAPEVFSDSLVPQRLPVRQGCFTLRFSDEILHRSLERCWLLEGARVRDVTRQTELVQAVTDGGGCAMTEVKARAVARLTYRLRGVQSGEVLAVMRRRFEYGSVDLSQPRLREYVRRWLSTFDGLRVAGYAWDEPHFGFAFWREDGRAISDRLYRLFQRRFGYDLRDRLADLWLDQSDGRSALTRLHYAELLEQALADLEKDFAQQAHRKLGQKTRVFLGIHRTMHEETSDDFYIGCCDYFRHNRHTSGGFTDSVFEREDSMLTMLHLARSMAAANGGPAWNNSWGFVPQEEHHAYYLRLMGAMQVGWIGHTYHSSGQFGPGYPHHPLWATLAQHLAAHRRLFAALEGAQPAADTAVLYNWRALAAFPGNYLHIQRRNLLLLGKALTYAQVQFQFVDADVPRRAGRWRRVIVPWPDLLPPGALARLGELAAAGTEVLIFGPPADDDASGSPQAAAFARLCGIRPVERSTELQMKEGAVLHWNRRAWRLAPTAVEPRYRSNERASYPGHFKGYVLRPRPGTEVVATTRGKPVAVRRGGVTYFAAELPHFAGLPEAVVSGCANPPHDWALFAYQRGSQPLLAGVARHAQPRDATIEWFGSRIRLEKCSSFVAAMERNGMAVRFSEGWNRGDGIRDC